MREITRDMVKMYNIKKLKYDFMGYTFANINDLSFHHLIIPKRECKSAGLGEGYIQWNGAILNQETSHDYLHIIERTDREIFLAITDCLVRENKLGQLSLEELKKIRELLLYFEKEHDLDENRQGKRLIKTKYKSERIKL